MNTGKTRVISQNRLLSTVAYRFKGTPAFALEGSIFMAGASVQWLRDELGIISSAAQTQTMMEGHGRKPGIYLVPAFTGLGAPYWDPDARGAIFGLTRSTNSRDLVRATLESVCYQTHDLLVAMGEDGTKPKALRVDGGMVANDWLVQTLSNIIDLPIDRPHIMETTALGAAYLVGLQAGLYDSLSELSEMWQRDAAFEPDMSSNERDAQLSGWADSIKKVLTR